MKQVGWRENKKDQRLEVLCPEWLWISLFILVIGILGAVAFSFDPIEPKSAIAEQIVPFDQETPAEGKEMAKKWVLGVASWYDYSLNGINWSKDHNTCAAREEFERYSTIRVTNLDNGKTVDCYINDYGPETCEERIKKGLDNPGECIERLIDLSSHAFSHIADLKSGLINIRIEEIK